MCDMWKDLMNMVMQAKIVWQVWFFLQAAHVIITTPEKWDGISRSWQTRNYVKQVALIIIDEIHLLGN